MATGRGNKIVGQAGEYLVAAELSRRGLIATTFTGNVPHYDIIASDESGKHVSVQVKDKSANSRRANINTQYLGSCGPAAASHSSEPCTYTASADPKNMPLGSTLCRIRSRSFLDAGGVVGTSPSITSSKPVASCTVSTSVPG